MLLLTVHIGPLEGKPSDNGQFEAQVFFSRTRPLEGLPRGHWPSETHPSGHKLAAPSVILKNWGKRVKV